jgi:peptidoglycan-N-acetylglucosamine deacetylase
MTRRTRSRRLLLALIGLVVAGSALVAIQPLWVFGAIAWVMPGIVWRVDTTEPLVALSFDDGPAPDHTPHVLEILARHHSHATFFLIGDRAAAYPDFADRLRSQGHEVGNHYATLHSAFGATPEDFLANLTHTEEILGLHGRLKLFRPPGGRIRPSQIQLAEEHGYRVVLGSAYPYDPAHPPSAYIRWLVVKNLGPGTIVILHDGIREPSRMIAALDSILTAGESRGFRFVTVGELLRAGDQRP